MYRNLAILFIFDFDQIVAVENLKIHLTFSTFYLNFFSLLAIHSEPKKGW
jgi:hypothetical protein